MSSAFWHVFGFKTKTFTQSGFDLMVTLDEKKEAQQMFKYNLTLKKIKVVGLCFVVHKTLVETNSK